jgi:hypothetical protein
MFSDSQLQKAVEAVEQQLAGKGAEEKPADAAAPADADQKDSAN